MKEEDIPILTEVHSAPAAPHQALPITQELLTHLTKALKPALLTEVEAAVTQNLRQSIQQDLMNHLLSESANIQKANQAYLSSALNQHYTHQNQQLSQRVDETFKTSAQALKAHINAEIQALQQSSVTELKSVIQHEINDAIRKNVADAEQAILKQMAQFVDKTQADLATTIPQMLQTSASIVKIDLDNTLKNMQTQSVAEVEAKLLQSLPQLEENLIANIQASLSTVEKSNIEDAVAKLQSQIQRLHENILKEHKSSLADELVTVYRDLTQQTHTELNVYLDALQLQSQQQLEQKMLGAFPVLYQGYSDDLIEQLKLDLNTLAETAKADFNNRLNADLPEIEAKLANKVQQILALEIPSIAQNTSQTVKAEVSQMLSSVRLTIPHEISN